MRESAAGIEHVLAMFGYDLRVGRFVLDRFPSSDASPQTDAPAAGGWDGETLTLLQNTPAGPLRFQYAFLGADQYTFALSFGEEGHGWRTAREGTYDRRTPDRPDQYRH